MTPTQIQRTRESALAVIENDRAGRVVDPTTLAWAVAFVRQVPQRTAEQMRQAQQEQPL